MLQSLKRLSAIGGVLVAFLTLGLVAPEMASASVTERWTGFVNCRFVSGNSYIPVRALVQSMTQRGHAYKRVVQLNWKGSEHPNSINAWEKRGAQEIYTGGLAGWNPKGASSGYTPRFSPPWMITGASRYARGQFKRPNVPSISSVCGFQINIG